jgi:hypothetical protein
MQLLVCAVELLEYVGSFSTTKTVPLKSGLSDRNHAVDDPIMAPPTITTS